MTGLAMRRREKRRWKHCGDCDESWRVWDTVCPWNTLPGAAKSSVPWRRRGSVWESTDSCVCDNHRIDIGSRRPALWSKKFCKARDNPFPEVQVTHALSTRLHLISY